MFSTRFVTLAILLVIEAAFSLAQATQGHSPIHADSIGGTVIWQYDTKG